MLPLILGIFVGHFWKPSYLGVSVRSLAGRNKSQSRSNSLNHAFTFLESYGVFGPEMPLPSSAF